ncbi:hypothetical protein O181_092044 [Austropuccinia psidii MF-1]|uniref:Uncharacterized protein n=1 Tax=Austropuccinia psidii MF-1 TaxID=1389203 RepID=A0A9Q3IYI4_9BASI|nr:hypothetical protein [Austropuccinia psidii MF-1]
MPFGPSLGETAFWPYSAPLASLANSQSHHPPGQYLISGPGGSFPLPGASGPSSLIQGLNVIFGPFRSPTAPTVCGPWDQLGPIWTNSNEAKRGKGGRPAAPNSRWVHLSLILAIIPKDSKWPKSPRTQDT